MIFLCLLIKTLLLVFFLLDLSTAFNTINHSILIACLERWGGLSGIVLDWFHSCLSRKEIFVSLGRAVLHTFDMEYGVPQGGILGPIFFSLYMLPLGNIINYHNVRYRLLG